MNPWVKRRGDDHADPSSLSAPSKKPHSAFTNPTRHFSTDISHIELDPSLESLTSTLPSSSSLPSNSRLTPRRIPSLTRDDHLSLFLNSPVSSSGPCGSASPQLSHLSLVSFEELISTMSDSLRASDYSHEHPEGAAFARDSDHCQGFDESQQQGDVLGDSGKYLSRTEYERWDQC